MTFLGVYIYTCIIHTARANLTNIKKIDEMHIINIYKYMLYLISHLFSKCVILNELQIFQWSCIHMGHIRKPDLIKIIKIYFDEESPRNLIY
jgi:hypothetical protein